ncbi:DUF2953 domain-containing protein [Bacillus taeanensis]|uniref:DUF2953 domain-containing protein n=1 Tax=Bacillus taeanensis TaxID=273032 RepID=UPI0015F0D4C2|nr:DUF2953 domain-containing protein [Bacillus taeanensis]
MNGWIVTAFIIGVLVLLLFVTKVTITILYVHSRDDDQLVVTFKAWYGLISYTLNVPLIKVEDSTSLVVKSEKSVNNDTQQEDTQKFTPLEMIKKIELFQDFLQDVIGFHKIVRSFLKHVSITKFEWKSVVGVNDAALTGMVIGVAWSIKGSLIGLVSTYMNLKAKPQIEVHPAFQTAVSQTRFVCMFSFRIGHAIGAGLKVVKFWKGRPLPLKKSELSKETT